jgi:hypothetical protein
MSEVTLDYRTLAAELWETNKQFVDALVRVELAAQRDEQLQVSASSPPKP